jgi:hypothetical protein
MMIHKKLAEIQLNLVATKSQTNKFGNYNYRSCEDILEAVKPLLGDCTLVVTDKMVVLGSVVIGSVGEQRFYVEATATLSDGKDSISSVAYAREALAQKGMAESQLTGATSSYARKYALNGLLLIDDNKDADTQKPPEREQMNPEPINFKAVEAATAAFKELIDADDFEAGHQRAKDARKRLSNDEWMAVSSNLNEYAQGSRKKLKTLAVEYINYTPEEARQ